jgi:peptidase E
VKTLNDRDAGPAIRAAALAGKRIIRISAGSILTGHSSVHFDEHDDSRHRTRHGRFDCLDIVPTASTCMQRNGPN